MSVSRTAIRCACTLAFTLAAALAAPKEAGDSLSLDLVLGYYPPNLDGYDSTGFAPVDFGVIEGGPGQRDLGTGWGGVAALATLTYARPLQPFTGGPLLSGAGLVLAGRIELSPVTVEASGFLTLKPAAFLELQAGASTGTGWSLGFVGLALNPTPDLDPVEETPFGGALYRAWFTGTLQFDLAALFPGEWNHIVARASSRFELLGNTAAAPGQAWYWQADEGMNFNGWRHLGTYVLGYRMPLRLSFVGVMVETEAWLGRPRAYAPMTTGWGSDFVTVRVSPLASLSLGDRDSLSFLVQLKGARDWTDSTARNRSFQQRDYEGRVWKLDRILLSYARRLR
ncbi:MAG TPA: hypothetical protein VLH39_05700 [Magnetospirillaceae bacterium]|nr:hypothetical protein [Magnetospirillaceae bacterium]